MRGEDYMRSRMPHQIEIDWIRHGKTLANEKKCYLGRTQEALSERGRREICEKKQSYPAADVVVGSPMLRCIQTAELLYPGRDVKTIDGFREMDFGIFEGKNYLELSAAPEYQAWIDSNALMPIPGGESRKAFIRRCQDGMQEVVAWLDALALGDDGCRRAAAIVHGGTIMALLSTYDLCGRDYFSYSCENGGGYRSILCWAYAEEKGIYDVVLKNVMKLDCKV